MMPVTVDSEGTQSLYITPPESLSIKNAQRSVREISSQVNTFGWVPEESVSSETKTEFLRILAESEQPDRVKKMIKRLYDQNPKTGN